MHKLALITTIALLIVGSTAVGQSPDTVRIGDGFAYYMGNGVIRVPVYMNNRSHELIGASLSFTASTTSPGIYADSITRSGRTSGTNIFDLFMSFSNGYYSEGGTIDSICAGFISMQHYLPAGAGEIGEMWFSNVWPGDLLSFIKIDTLGVCSNEVGGSGWDNPLTFLTSHLQVIESDLAISCASEYSVQATHLLSFPITVYGLNTPVSLQINDFYGYWSEFPEPSLTGDGPWTFNWQPAYGNVGDFTLELLATDALGNTSTRNVSIHVTEITGDPGDVLRGDMNCDGNIDITDLLLLVNYMFNGGPPADCN
ncbi:MAG TPA: hypothetical protein PLF13_02020 [candidate division Zixibacteria bacterium]|nr:hypothetical protein [candidate division Zixibacteria bacterium]